MTARRKKRRNLCVHRSIKKQLLMPILRTANMIEKTKNLPVPPPPKKNPILPVKLTWPPRKNALCRFCNSRRAHNHKVRTERQRHLDYMEKNYRVRADREGPCLVGSAASGVCDVEKR